MDNIDYSVVIRTIGKAGEKYQNLLDSVSRLTPQPKEVIVVLPEGYDLPAERLGWETFYYSPKGMVAQRMYGMKKCTSQYALVCDDDVTFESDFVQKLYKPIMKHNAAFAAGPLLSFLPKRGVQTIAGVVTAGAVPTLFHKERYITVLRSTGYSFNRDIDLHEERYYEAQSLPWTCFFADLQVLDELEFSAETWLDRNGYAAYDDQTMFYKAWLRGFRTLVVSTAVYEHQDARTSTRNNKPAVLYSIQYNRLVFWHRFVFSQQSNWLLKVWSVLCYGYRFLWGEAYNAVDLLRKRITFSDIRTMHLGWRDGWRYIHSPEYRALPDVK